MKKKSVFNILKIIFSLAFILFILYYFFGKNSDSLQEHLKDRVKIEFVLLSMIFGGLAYISRGLRWVALVDAIGYNTSKKNAIAAVSIGYFTNLFSQELVRFLDAPLYIKQTIFLLKNFLEPY